MNNPSLLKEIAVLILYSQGVEQQQIAERLCLPKPFVARAIRRITPKIRPDEDEANISRAAYDLIQSKMTDRKKEIVALLSSGKNQSEVARTIGIARQEVSRALKSIPTTYRYDKHAR
jgi:DNA-binding transcriptional regulator LsrR (DeoR family)